jgi:hypothetical protein
MKSWTPLRSFSSASSREKLLRLSWLFRGLLHSPTLRLRLPEYICKSSLCWVPKLSARVRSRPGVDAIDGDVNWARMEESGGIWVVIMAPYEYPPIRRIGLPGFCGLDSRWSR